jgi:hypothetical protein
MALNSAALDAMNDGLAAVVTHVALHDGPLSGDEASDARQAVSWAASSSGELSLSVAEEFTGDPGQAVTDVGLWSASTGGTFYGTVPISTGNLAIGSTGAYTLNDLTITTIAS